MAAGTRKVQNITQKRLEGLEAGFNELVGNLKLCGVLKHGKATAQITTADSGADADSVILANVMRLAYIEHCADVDAHIAADAANTIGSAATDASSAYTLLNDIKAKFNLHIARAASHNGLGGVGGIAAAATVSTTDASSQATGIALANALKAALNKHFASSCRAIELVAS